MKLKAKYYKKDILIVGFGKTGQSILRFFKNQKVNLFIYDDNLVSLIGDFMAQRSKKTNQKGVNLNMRPRNYTACLLYTSPSPRD